MAHSASVEESTREGPALTNDEESEWSRRTVLRTTDSIAIAAVFAGCLGDSGGTTSGSRDSTESDVEDPPDYDGWFEDVENDSGTVDERARDSVSVRVGAGSGGLAFDPAAVLVSPGTTVLWNWTGDGGTHNVAAQNSEFESERSNSRGYTFEHTFEAAGVYAYVCEPHRSAGMKGAVVVGDSVPESFAGIFGYAIRAFHARGRVSVTALSVSSGLALVHPSRHDTSRFSNRSTPRLRKNGSTKSRRFRVTKPDGAF